MSVMENLSTKIHNASTDPQKSDRFNVRFLGIPENISDFLSRQVKTLTPPAITFQTLQHSGRRATFQDVGKVESEILSIGFTSDGEGIVDTILMTQILRQKGIEVSGFGGNRKFDIQLEVYNAKSELVRTETYKRCFVSSLQRPDLEVVTDMPSLYTATIQYDEIEYSIENESYPLISS